MATSKIETTPVTLTFETEQIGENKYKITLINPQPAVQQDQQDVQIDEWKKGIVPITLGIAAECVYNPDIPEYHAQLLLNGNYMTGKPHTGRTDPMSFTFSLGSIYGWMVFYLEDGKVLAKWEVFPPNGGEREHGDTVLYPSRN